MSWEQIGMQAAGTASAGLLGMALGGYNDRRQREQQEDLTRIQIRGQKEMTDYQMMKQLEMWKATNFPAQLAMMKEAGLSPGLMYGKGGPGGTTVGSAQGNVTGANAPTGGGEIQAMMGMGMQLQLLKAQKENIEADTQLKQADAEKTSGVDTGLARTQIMQLTAGVDNIRAETALKQVQTTIGNIEASIKGRTEEDAVRAVGWAAEKTMQEMESLRFQNNITDETWKVKVGIIKTELIHLLLSNQQIAAQTTLTETQTRQVANSIYQKWQELEIGLRGVSTQEKRQKEDAWRNDVQESTKIPFQILDDVIEGILRKGMQRPRNTYKEGSNSRGEYWESTQHY